MKPETGPLGRYFRAVRRVDAASASAQVLSLLDDGEPVPAIAAGVLARAQERVGELWESGEWSVADEHAATAVTETALGALVAAAGTGPGGGPHVAVACAEGEWHALPARLAGAIAEAAGARVTVLGPSMPAEHLGRRLAAGDVDVLALSCTVATNLIGAARCVAAAHGAGVPVVAGGAAFAGRPRRAAAVGADRYADSAAALAQPPPALSGRDSTVPKEALMMDGLDGDALRVAGDLLIAGSPLAAADRWQQDQAREALRLMCRFTAAAVLTGDPTVLDDYLGWLLRLRAGPLPAGAVSAAAELVCDAVADAAPVGAPMLRAAAHRAAAAVGD